MKIQFLGAAGTVTGSKYLLKHFDKKYLVDCGLFQGAKEWRSKNWEDFPIDPKSIDAVVLTHAHIDHSGCLPLIVKNGFKGKIYCSKATFELCKILLPDSAHLQEEDAEFANSHHFSKHDPALPLYSVEDANRCLEFFHPLEFNQKVYLSKNDNLTFFLKSAGHILGASLVIFESDLFSLCFTGDLGKDDDAIMKPPKKIQKIDFLVMESTYGNRLHEQTSSLDQLEKVVHETIQRQGTLIIPAFSVGRSQHVIYLLYQLRQSGRLAKNIQVYLDSPMAIKATDLFVKFHHEHRISFQICNEMLDFVQYVQTARDSKKIAETNEPKIIISASGMMTGGRVLHHVKCYGPDEKNSILLVGYQAEGTRGDTLKHGGKKLKIHGEEIPINSHVYFMDGLSSHADQLGLMNWVKNFSQTPQMIFITHGNPEASSTLKDKIEKELNFHVKIPQYLEEFDLLNI